MLIDTHAHLTDELYGGCGGIIANMKSDNLEKIITVGFDMESSDGAYEIAKNNADVYCAVGFHPCDVKKIKDGDLDRLLEISRSDKCVAIGEIGLDYHYDDTDKRAQKKGLLQMFELVEAADLPAVFHIRDADGDMLAAVKENISKFKKGGVVHCFSGSKETALDYVNMGFYISFTGVITFRNAAKFPDIIRALPKDRILVETDCPFLAPPPHRGELNYPAYVRYQAEKIAEILGVGFDEVEKTTTENAHRLFGF